VWKGICHEQVLPDPRTTPVFAKTEKVLIKQLRDSTKSRQSYLDLMAAEVMENPVNIRSKMYYARELGINNKLEECLAELDKCIDALNNVDQSSSNDSLTKVLSLDEISYIYCTKAKCLDGLNRYPEAVATFKAACEIMPKREPMLDFAVYCLNKEDYSSCFHYASQSLMIPQPEFSTFLDDPTCFGFKPWNLRAISAFRLGKIDIAIESAKMALQLDPSNENLKGNLEYFEEIEKNQNKDNKIKVI
jgi:tetratricopeptide (TPR) repeat protein